MLLYCAMSTVLYCILRPTSFVHVVHVTWSITSNHGLEVWKSLLYSAHICLATLAMNADSSQFVALLEFVEPPMRKADVFLRDAH